MLGVEFSAHCLLQMPDCDTLHYMVDIFPSTLKMHNRYIKLVLCIIENVYARAETYVVGE